MVQLMARCWPGDKTLSEAIMDIVYWRIYASLGLNELNSQKTAYISHIRARYGMIIVSI